MYPLLYILKNSFTIERFLINVSKDHGWNIIKKLKKKLISQVVYIAINAE